MSYKVELSREEHTQILSGTLQNWSNQEHDVQLLSMEGYRIVSHRKILSFYSSQLRKIFNEPEIAFSSQIPTLSLPASSSCISSLVNLLVTGKSEKSSLQEVRQLATALGINLKNCLVDKKASITKVAGISVVKLPLGNEEGKAKSGLIKPILGNKIIPKPVRVEPVLKKASPGPIDTIGSIKSFKDKLEKSGSGLRIELKGMEDVKPVVKTEKDLDPTTSMKKPKCVDCGIVFKDINYLNKHRERKHGEAHVESSIEEEDVTKNGFERVNCNVCDKRLSRQSIDRHLYRKHGLKKKQIQNMHIKIEEDGNPVDSNCCNLCGKECRNAEMLLKHMRIKHTRGYKCDECPKSFKVGSELRVHKRIHLPDSEKPYECDVCQKKFCQTGQKRVHMKKFHDFEVPLESQNLSKAGQSASESSMLDTSNATDEEHSLVEVAVTSSDGTLEIPSDDNCGYCGDKFSNVDDLNNHIASAHN